MDDTTNLREVIREAISGSWSTMPTCWEAQTNAVLAALPCDLVRSINGPVEEIAWDLRELIGPRLDEAHVRDADGVAALVADVVSPVIVRLRAELAEAQRERAALIDEVKTLQDDLEAFSEAQKAWLQFRRERDALKAAVERIEIAFVLMRAGMPDGPQNERDHGVVNVMETVEDCLAATESPGDAEEATDRG